MEWECAEVQHNCQNFTVKINFFEKQAHNSPYQHAEIELNFEKSKS